MRKVALRSRGMSLHGHHRAMVLSLLVGLGAQTTMAHADATQDRVLLVPTLLGGPIPDAAEWRKEFDGRVADALRRSRRLKLVPSKQAINAAGICLDTACSRSIVEREHADGLIAARVMVGAEHPPMYRVSVTVYDRAHDDLRTREDRCVACSEFQAAELLGKLSAFALEPEPRNDSRGDTVPTPLAADPAPLPSMAPHRPAERWPSRSARYALVAVTAAVGAGGLSMLSVGARALALDGAYVSGPEPGFAFARDRYDTRTAGIALLAFGGTCVLGSVVGLVFELRALHVRRPR